MDGLLGGRVAQTLPDKAETEAGVGQLDSPGGVTPSWMKLGDSKAILTLLFLVSYIGVIGCSRKGPDRRKGRDACWFPRGGCGRSRDVVQDLWALISDVFGSQCPQM